jgi:hypothetical protein
MKTSVLSVLTIVLVLFASCRKQDKSLPDTQQETFAYNGTDTFLLRISQEAAALQVATNLPHKPAWNKVSFNISLADTFIHVMLPVLGSNGIISDYVKLYLQPHNRKVLGGEYYNITNDYTYSKDPVKKVRIGADLRALRQSGLRLPESFSDSALKVLQRKLLRIKKGKSNANAREEPTCISDVELTYQYYPTKECQDAIPQLESLIIVTITGDLSAQAALIGGFANVQSVSGGLTITTSANLVGMVEQIINQAMIEVTRLSYGCLPGTFEVNVTSTCTGDDGDGGSETPPGDNEDFCAAPLSEEEMNVILQDADATAVTPNDATADADPQNPGMFLDDEELKRGVPPTWMFFHYNFLRGTYTEFTTYYIGLIVRATKAHPWKWAALEYDHVVKTFNNLPSCLSVDVTVNANTINISADSTVAVVGLDWTYTTSAPIIGGLKLFTNTKHLTRYMYAEHYKDK